jgi:hypothetical protein
VATRFRYPSTMRRFAPNQPDLFAPRQPDLFAPADPVETTPERPPLEELADMLALLRDAKEMPWPTLRMTMEKEYRAMYLGSLAGPEGKKLASAIMDETERLFAAEERAAAKAVAAQ